MKSVFKLTIWVLAALFASMGFAQDEELLEPDKAFALNVEAVDASQLAVTWTIADGYYMYRDKFEFDVTAGANKGEVKFPKGKTKHDEFFGDVEIYEHQARFTMNISNATEKVALRLVGQGCNEPVGVCYPPIIKELELLVPAAAAQVTTPVQDAPVQTGPTDGLDAVSALRNLLGDVGMDDEFLPVEEAFKLKLASAKAGAAVNASFEIANGYYLYKDKVSFEVVAGGARIGEIEMPQGKEKDDEYFGLMEVYLRDFDVNIPMIRANPAATEITLKAGYQGCAEKGICYPPVSQEIVVALPELAGTAMADTGEAQGVSVSATSSNQPAESASGEEPESKGLLAYLLAAFGVGVALTFTPCVLPMIPILSSIIVGQGEKASKAKGGLLSAVYVLGTAVTYAAIGWVAGATGEQLQAYFQNIWAIGFLSLVFAAMSLSMFGLYKIQMPSFIQSRMQEKSAGIQGGTLGMVFVLGLMSALIVGACVSPLLISLLSIAISQGDPVLGMLMMTAMAAGMGVFLIAIGFGAGFLLPKAGMWMDRVNYVFGVMLLGVAIYLLTVIPEVPVLLLWAALFIVTGIYMGATQSLPEGASGWRYLNKGLGTVLLVWGILALIGGLNGNRDIMNPIPLSGFGGGPVVQGGGAAAESHEELFIQVANMDALETEMQNANAIGKHVMLDFYADWCTDCIRMEKTTFVEKNVKAKFDRSFVLLQVDLTDPNDPDTKAIKKRFGVYGPPAMLFFRNGLDEVRDERLYGYRTADEFLQILNRI